jgi:hypothetical protein
MANFLPENLENSIQEIYSTVYQKSGLKSPPS